MLNLHMSREVAEALHASLGHRIEKLQQIKEERSSNE
jgi:hypothetical protein